MTDKTEADWADEEAMQINRQIYGTVGAREDALATALRAAHAAGERKGKALGKKKRK